MASVPLLSADDEEHRAGWINIRSDLIGYDRYGDGQRGIKPAINSLGGRLPAVERNGGGLPAALRIKALAV
jgi:hypothetical protein